MGHRGAPRGVLHISMLYSDVPVSPFYSTIIRCQNNHGGTVRKQFLDHRSRQLRREFASALQGAGAEGHPRATPIRVAAPLCTTSHHCNRYLHPTRKYQGKSPEHKHVSHTTHPYIAPYTRERGPGHTHVHECNRFRGIDRCL